MTSGIFVPSPDSAETSPRPARPSGPRKLFPVVAIPGFQLRRVVGTGGMGVVYEAWDERLERAVAVKLLHSGGFADPQGAERFRFEAQVVARLRHPHIVQPHQFGDVDGAAYLVMEYVDGPNLHTAAGGLPVPPAAAAAVVRAAAEGVGFAHRNGVIHRDLKPANILLTGPDLAAPVRVTDFGMARLMADDPEFSQDGTVAGTPGYMAPEQCTLTGEVGPWTDVYALGVVLYELLTGRLPVPSEPAELYLGLVQKAQPLAPRHFQPGVPADLESVCLKCLAKAPPDRYLTADALADDLQRFAAGRPVVARRIGAAGTVLRAAYRYPFVSALVLSTVASLAAGTTVSTLLYRHAEARRIEAEVARAEEVFAQTATAVAAERTRAEKERADAKTREATKNDTEVTFVRDYFLNTLLYAARRNGDGPAAVTALTDVLRDGERKFADNPDRLARLRLLVGQRLSDQESRKQAEACFRKILDAPAWTSGRPIDRAYFENSAVYHLSILLGLTGRAEEAVALTQRYIPKCEATFGPRTHRR